MKTTIDIPDAELQDLIRLTRAKTKKQAVVTAVLDYNHRSRMKRVAAFLGTFDEFVTPAELRKARAE